MLSDKELIERYTAQKNQVDLSTLFLRYHKNIFKCAMHYLKNAPASEDACTDIYLELKDKIPRYDIKDFPAWLHRLTTNHCLKKLAKKGRLILGELKNLDEKVEFDIPEDHMSELIEKLPQAIDDLSEDQRWCIVLFYLRGFTYQQIEETKGYTFNKIKSSIQHGKKNLKKKLAQHVG